MKNKLIRWWNTLLLIVAVKCIAKLNRSVVEADALWDKAQNAAEIAVGKDVVKLLQLGKAFTIIAARCNERADDLVSEAKQHAEKVEAAYKKHVEPNLSSSGPEPEHITNLYAEKVYQNHVEPNYRIKE